MASGEQNLKTEVLVGNYNLDDFNKQTKLF